MSATEKLMVVSTLDRVTVGDSFDSLPPHLTVFPPFEIDELNVSEFLNDIRDITLENPAAHPEGGSRVLFGADETIPARRLDQPTAGFNVIQHFNIHAAAFRSVNELGGVYDPSYVGLNYAPHISESADHSVAEGKVVLLDNLTVLKKDVERRKKLVIAVYLWDKLNG
jgi:hypothetical protein